MHKWTFIYDKDGIKNNGERMVFDSRSTGNPYRKKKILTPILPSTKVSLRWTMNLNVKSKTVRLSK